MEIRTINWYIPFIIFQKGFEKEDNANVPTPAISSDVYHSSTTPVLESSEVDMMSDSPTEIRTPRDTLNKNHEMDNGTTIDAEPPIGNNTFSN